MRTKLEQHENHLETYLIVILYTEMDTAFLVATRVYVP